tara:strand:- start:142 stop:1152 length:1011 start_codon:yes stop_codon:yes gene_type:complete
MKLLIITQVVDREHPVLGFFHQWISEFAAHCERVTVVCLQSGEYDLPENVTVVSLGKERGAGRFSILKNFYQAIISNRSQYNSVFVHMNQIYVILGWPIWFLLRKRISLWYTHGTVSLSLRLATLLADKIFTASNNSFNVSSAKVIVTGHGINTNHFAPQQSDKKYDLISVGRISRAKNLHTLIDVLHSLSSSAAPSLALVGTPVTTEDEAYEEELKNKILELSLQDRVHFIGKVTQQDLPETLNSAKVFVTSANNGSLDKAILEAMACGLPVVSMAEGSKSLPLGSNQVADTAAMSEVISRYLSMENTRDVNNTSCIKNQHSLKQLIPSILKSLS